MIGKIWDRFMWGMILLSVIYFGAHILAAVLYA